VVDVESTCGSLMLVDSQAPLESYFMEKLQMLTPTCGSQMPLGGSLDADAMACVAEWLSGLASAPPTAPVVDAGEEAVAVSEGGVQ
jgi:hypothetical protein